MNVTSPIRMTSLPCSPYEYLIRHADTLWIDVMSSTNMSTVDNEDSKDASPTNEVFPGHENSSVSESPAPSPKSDIQSAPNEPHFSQEAWAEAEEFLNELWATMFTNTHINMEGQLNGYEETVKNRLFSHLFKPPGVPLSAEEKKECDWLKNEHMAAQCVRQAEGEKVDWDIDIPDLKEVLASAAEKVARSE